MGYGPDRVALRCFFVRCTRGCWRPVRMGTAAGDKGKEQQQRAHRGPSVLLAEGYAEGSVLAASTGDHDTGRR